MKHVLRIVALVCGMNAYAYSDQTFSCRNSDATLPNNTYKISTLSVSGVGIPYLEITRHFKNQDGSVKVAVAKGMAAYFSSESNREVLTLSSIMIEIENDEMVNCRPN